MVKDNKIDILGILVDRVNYKQAMDIFDEIMKEEGCGLIATPNSEIIVSANNDQKLKEILDSARLVVPDGIGIIYASKILGMPLNERVTGIDFLGKILSYLEENNKSIYFLGSKTEILDMAILNIIKIHPNLKVVGTHDGYFNKDEEESIVEEINKSGADFLCVALGSPKQEKFIYEHKNELNPRAAMGVGGSLDVISGTLKRAPEFYRNNGLEWLYRLMQQPSRYKRMGALPVFMLRVLVNRFSGKSK
jgi:N-acetylglucosaminyldiphosphoundecaprenol N-acetyl-beta-D-mannosaminyltransferase